jgi:hypothetical protein
VEAAPDPSSATCSVAVVLVGVGDWVAGDPLDNVADEVTLVLVKYWSNTGQILVKY